MNKKTSLDRLLKNTQTSKRRPAKQTPNADDMLNEALPETETPPAPEADPPKESLVDLLLRRRELDDEIKRMTAIRDELDSAIRLQWVTEGSTHPALIWRKQITYDKADALKFINENELEDFCKLVIDGAAFNKALRNGDLSEFTGWEEVEEIAFSPKWASTLDDE